MQPGRGEKLLLHRAGGRRSAVAVCQSQKQENYKYLRIYKNVSTVAMIIFELISFSKMKD